jgi:hypothetical protein
MSAKQKILAHFDGRWELFYGRFVQLPAEKNGSVLVNSPLRDNDINPSFQITFQGQFAGRWHDFGTSENGDAFDFFRRVRGTETFTETLSGIAKEFGLMDRNEGRFTQHKTKLPKCKQVKTLAQRGISQETTTAFKGMGVYTG